MTPSSDPAGPEVGNYELQIYERPDHPVSRKHISDNALKVISRLNRSGHEAYLVGGAIRDLYLGGQPKDFDVATDATPEQVNDLFRNSRIIGRRFKIVHVRFGREIIEVTTFRGHHEAEVSKTRRSGGQQAVKSEGGMLLRDNVYGNLEEDALRRDFTINALYYSSRDFTVLDYVDGVEDLENRQIRIIGDPSERYREDPVRMLRAARFAARLDFTIAADTAAPIRDLAVLLQDIPAARLFDEVLKLFMTGKGQTTFEVLTDYALVEPLFPSLARQMDRDDGYARALAHLALASTDRRIAQGKPVTPAFLFAAFLWPEVVHQRDIQQQNGLPPTPALTAAAQDALAEQSHTTTIPRRFSTVIRDIWDLQLRLPKRSGKRVQQTFEHRRFRAAYDFILLREEAGENLGAVGQWWTEYQETHPAPERREPDPPPRRRRPRNRKHRNQ